MWVNFSRNGCTRGIPWREMNKESGGIAVMVKRGLISSLGVMTGSYLLDGIDYSDNGSLFLAVVLLGVFLAVLKPLLVLLALPFVVVTLGLGVLFINALLYLLVGNLLEGFTVDSFGTAFFGALIVTFFNVGFSNWINGTRRVSVSGQWNATRRGGPASPKKQPKAVKAKDDVIDI